MVGVARCFYTAGRLNTLLYDPMDPGGVQRQLHEDRFALDHFQKKLLTLADAFQTPTGQRLARERHCLVEGFYLGFLDEIGGQ